MASKPTMLTAEGHKKLEEELEFLQNVKRKEIAEKIKVSSTNPRFPTKEFTSPLW